MRAVFVIALFGWVLLAGRAAWESAWRGRRRLELTALGLLSSTAAALAALAAASPRLFERAMQEDGWAEWGTVFAFGLACGLFLLRARAGRGLLERLGLVALAAFCLFVAGEEISWGQRLLGFQPPEVFLEHNFQQELNVHNLLTKKKLLGLKLDSRFLIALIAVLYAGVLPWLTSKEEGPLALLRPFAAAAPAPALRHLFALVAAVELAYPVDLTGEAAELFFGQLFLASAALPFFGLRPRPQAAVAIALLAPLVLGVATASGARLLLYGADEALVAETRRELELLRADLTRDGFVRKKLKKKRVVHKRLFTATRAKYLRFDETSSFLEGASTPARPEEASVRRDRRGYFLDPWNNPYWLVWRKKSARLTLYSFGPNRQRDGDFVLNAKEKGDDIAVTLSLRKRKSPAGDQP
jgi:hypothetical protein